MSCFSLLSKAPYDPSSISASNLVSYEAIKRQFLLALTSISTYVLGSVSLFFDIISVKLIRWSTLAWWSLILFSQDLGYFLLCSHGDIAWSLRVRLVHELVLVSKLKMKMLCVTSRSEHIMTMERALYISFLVIWREVIFLLMAVVWV